MVRRDPREPKERSTSSLREEQDHYIAPITGIQKQLQKDSRNKDRSPC